ncbi:porin [Paraburkholderia sp. B3]|uniref:porin n=1 Tax=Paraburkholderia sp. B3 TaxID=3134791 RepID=UPI0039824819
MYKQRGLRLKLIAAATCLLAGGAAHAQSSVTLYGLVDGGLLYTSKTLNTTTGQNAGHQFSMIDSGNSPSQFGVMGTEDLGGGLKAEFKLESGISMSNGGLNDSNGNLFGRQAYVGLDSNYGDVKVGLQFSPFFLSVYELDPRDLSQFGSGLLPYLDSVIATGIFNANSISYTSPKVYGFQGSVMLGLGGVAGDFQAGRNYSANLSYSTGTFLINAGFYDSNAGGAATPVPSTYAFEGRVIGMSYKFGKLTAKASFTSYKGTGLAGSFNDNVYSGGLDWLVTPRVDLNGGVWYTSDRSDTTNHSVMGAIGTDYYLSRATTLYAQFGVVNNHGTMDTGLSVDSALNGAAGTTVGADIGIRHIF